MAAFVWLNRDAILAAHEASLQRFGGGAGIRDAGLLDSDLARPEMLAHYEPATNVFRLAASYAFGIAKNHPFVDGNRRSAFLAAYMFLRRNGRKLEASQTDVVVIMLGVAAGSVPEEKLGEWFESNSVKAKRQ